VFHRELLPCRRLGRPEQLCSTSGLEYLITDSVSGLGSARVNEYLNKLKERNIWDWTGILAVIITPDSVIHGGIAISGDAEHVEILMVCTLLFPEA